MIVHDRIVDFDPEAEDLRRQAADRREQGIGRHHAVVLRRDQRDAGVHQVLLGIQDVEGGALTDAGLFAHTVERHLGGGDLRLGGVDLRLGSIELSPGLHHRRLDLVARGVEIEPPLAQRLLGLTDRGIFGAALIDRHRELGGNRSLHGLDDRQRLGRPEALLHVADRGQGRRQRAFRDLHLVSRDVDVVHRGGDRGMLGATAGDGAIDGTRRQPVDRRRRREARRGRNADDLLILRPRRDVVRFGLRQLRPAGGETRLGLRHVGARHLARREAVAGLPQRHFEHVHVAALKLHDRGVTQQVHIRGGGIQQHALFGRAQGLTRGEHLPLGLAHAVGVLEAVEQRLRRGEPRGRHPNRAQRLGVGLRHRAVLGQVLEIVLGVARSAAHFRAVPGQRSRHVLVGGAGCGTLGVDLRIVLVGEDERRLHGGRARSGAHQRIADHLCRDRRHRKHNGCAKRHDPRAQSDPLPPPSHRHQSLHATGKSGPPSPPDPHRGTTILHRRDYDDPIAGINGRT